MSDIKYSIYESSVGYKVTGGTSSQFLKADGSVDSTTYATVSQLPTAANFVPYTGATANVVLGARSISSTGGFLGNATSATTLATARTINGTSFNGSANITTANWGTARNLTIGSTAKSVNGSANVAWSLAEIGAAAASHTHTFASLTSKPTTLSGYGITDAALHSGVNATGPWSHASQIIANNGTATAFTLNSSGATVSLLDATHGQGMGYINSVGTAIGNPSADWYYRIKMLHPNSLGYYGEIALQMTGIGAGSLWFKSVEAGIDYGWREAVDTGTDQIITGKKRYSSTGNSFTDHALEVQSTSAADPGMVFHKTGGFGGVLKLTSTGYQFMDISGTGFRPVEADGFVHRGIGGNNPNQILKSNGGMTGINLWDVIEEDGGLLVEPFIDYLISFNGGDIRNAVVYLINKEYDDFYINELRKGQRLHLINQNDISVGVTIDSTGTLFSIPAKYKATLIKSANNEYFLYDVTPYEMYTP